MHALMADAILAVHVLFILFVVVGEACIIAGGLRGWRWVRNVVFRVCHVLAIGIVAAQAWLGRLCPLTRWENALRQAAGGETYPGSFVGHWLGRLVYYDVPPWVFTLAYTLFGALVIVTWFRVPPRRRAEFE